MNMWIVVISGWVGLPESACTPGQGWVVLGSDARSGAKGAFPFSAYLCWNRVPGMAPSPLPCGERSLERLLGLEVRFLTSTREDVQV